MTTREAAHSLQRYGGRARERLRYRRATPPLGTRPLAVIGWTDFQSEDGFLMSYGADESTVARSAAPLVKKILEGEKPENIPVQQPTTFNLVFNLKTAEAIGVQIPPIMLARATRVIE
jgi:putative tryptophan/tyrosine transport system substrate-binding protein